MAEVQNMMTATHPDFRVFAGKRLESATAVKKRLGFSETSLNEYMKQSGFPKQIRFSRVRYFDSVQIDTWFLNR